VKYSTLQRQFARHAISDDDWRHSKTSQRKLNQIHDLLSNLEKETGKVLSRCSRSYLTRFVNIDRGVDGLERRIDELLFVQKILADYSEFLYRPKDMWGSTL